MELSLGVISLAGADAPGLVKGKLWRELSEMKQKGTSNTPRFMDNVEEENEFGGCIRHALLYWA